MSIITGFELASPRICKQMWPAGRVLFLPFAGTVLALLLTDLLGSVPIALGFRVVFSSSAAIYFAGCAAKRVRPTAQVVISASVPEAGASFVFLIAQPRSAGVYRSW